LPVNVVNWAMTMDDLDVYIAPPFAFATFEADRVSFITTWLFSSQSAPPSVAVPCRNSDDSMSALAPFR
jgi:hypothetical protein